MSSPSVPAVPGTGLVAILLMTRSRPGPRLVFHYPEDPTPSELGDSTEDADLSSESSDDEIHISRTPVHARATRFADISELVPSLGNMNPLAEKSIAGGEIIAGKVLGQAVESLEKILSPGRWCDGKKFEICLDGFTFVGHPVFAPEDGEWSPKPQREVKLFKSRNENANGNGHGGFLDVESFQSGSDTAPLVERNGQENPPATAAGYDFTHIADSFEDKGPGPRPGTSMESSSTNSGTASAEKMTMFHVVAVLQPEHARDARAVYTDILKGLSKALHYCQKQSNYVSVESRKLLEMKTKAKQKHRFTREDERSLYKSMIETSELAWALKEIYEKISVGEVAAFRLNGMEMALQCSLPTTEPEETLDPNAALLLLESREALLANLAHQPEAAPLAHFLQSLTPSKSLLKHSILLSIPLPSVLYLASHLLKWRKATLLSAPLHKRNYYTVSPNAPVHELGKHTLRCSAEFPYLPSLPNMMKLFSGKPIQYDIICPREKGHAERYMEMLSWLVRENFFVRLWRFGWVRVPRRMLGRRSESGSGRKGSGSEWGGRSGFMFGRLSEVAVVDDDSGSVSSERTAIQQRGHRRLSELAAANQTIGRKRGSDATTQGSVLSTQESLRRERGSTGSETSADEMVLVKTPGSEPHLLHNLTAELSGADPESGEILAAILPFLDGEHAFEGLSTRLGLKRGKIEKVIEELKAKKWMRIFMSV